MKKLAFSLILIALAIVATAQPPQAFNYQTIVRDAAGDILPNQLVAMRMSIRDASAVGTIIYQETFSETTNQFGLLNLNIGRGAPSIGTFSGIDWSNNSKFLEIEIDSEGGNNFVALGISELESVPYALHAETATNVDDADADPTNELQTVSKAGDIVTLSDGGGSFTDETDDADADPTNELQTVSKAGEVVTLSDGGGSFTDETEDADADPVNETNTSITLNGTNLKVTDAGGTITTDLGVLVDDPDADPTNELQEVTKVGNVVTLTGGGGSFVDEVDDSDADPANETNTSVLLDGTDLNTTDAGGTITTDLSSLVDDADADPVNELQTLSIIGNDLSISNGNVVPLPTNMPVGTSGQTINHDGTDWTASSNLFNNGTNVGIGTTTPASKLEVAGTVRANKFTDAQDATYFIDPSGNQTSGVLNGHLGIGGTPYWAQPFPGTPGWGPNLHLNSGQDTAHLWVGGHLTQSGAEVGHLSFIGEWNNPNLFGDKSSRYASITGKIISSGSQNYYPSGTLIFSTATGIPFTFPQTDPNFKEQMRITNEGYIGIGTADPWYKLHIEGGSIYMDNPGGGGDHGVHVENAGGHGFHVYNAGTHGFNVYNAGDHGVNVAQSGNDGVHVVAADNCGIDAEGDKGNHLRSYGSGYYGLYAHSLFNEPTNPGLYVYGTAYITGNLTAPTFNGNGAGLTNLNASNVSSGTLNNNRFNALSDLGGGSGTTFLRKDGTWANPTITTYSAGNDLDLSGTTFSLENDIDINYVRGTGSNGLKLFDDGGNGIYIRDGGNVGIGVSDPEYAKLCINAGASAGIKFTNDGTGPGYNDGFLLSWLSGGNSTVVLWNRENKAIAFGTNNTERFRIKEDGNVGIGTTAPTAKLSVNGTANKPGGGSWAVFSDARSKENIEVYKKGLKELMKLRPVSFNYKAEFEWGTDNYVGLIAQEVEKVVPSMVTEKEVNAIPDFKEVDPSELIYLVINAVQEQQSLIDELKSENDALQAKIELLENK